MEEGTWTELSKGLADCGSGLVGSSHGRLVRLFLHFSVSMLRAISKQSWSILGASLWYQSPSFDNGPHIPHETYSLHSTYRPFPCPLTTNIYTSTHFHPHLSSPKIFRLTPTTHPLFRTPPYDHDPRLVHPLALLLNPAS